MYRKSMPDHLMAPSWDAHIDHEDEGGGYPQHASTAAPFVPADWDECFERID